ncbi:hypothetical protein DUNSADRAFT_1586, partial [Dunaliella salina]
SAGRGAPVYVDSLPRRLVSEPGTSKGKRRAHDCSEDGDGEGQPRRKRVRNPVVSGHGWWDCLGVANQQAQKQAESAAKACSDRLAAAGRLVSAPKKLTESQVAGGFWHNLPPSWYRRFAHEPKGYKWLHCNDKWPARHRNTEGNGNNDNNGHDDSNDNKDNNNGNNNGNNDDNNGNNDNNRDDDDNGNNDEWHARPRSTDCNEDERSSSGGNGTSLHSHRNNASVAAAAAAADDDAPAPNDSENTPGSSMWRWRVNFMPRDKGGGGLSGGWRGFAIDHALYPGDVIFYEQITDPPSYGTHHWIVHVFRAYKYDTSVRPASAGSVPDKEPAHGFFDDDEVEEHLGNLEAQEQARANGGRTQTVSRAPKASGQCWQPGQQRQPQPHQDTSSPAAGCNGHVSSQQPDSGASNPPRVNKGTSRDPADSASKKNGIDGSSCRVVEKDSKDSNSSRGQAGKGNGVGKQGGGAKAQEGSRKRGQQQKQQQQRAASVNAQRHAMEEEEEEEEEDFYLKRIKSHMFAPPVGQSKPVDWFHIRWWGQYDCPQYDSWEPVSCLDQEPWKYAWAKGALPKKWQAQRAAWLQSLSAAGRAQFERDEAEEQALEEEEARAPKRK